MPNLTLLRHLHKILLAQLPAARGEHQRGTASSHQLPAILKPQALGTTCNNAGHASQGCQRALARQASGAPLHQPFAVQMATP